jgi:hypothetical protein
MILLVSILLITAGCTSSSISDILKQNHFPMNENAGLKIELRFLKESKGANYKAVDESSNAAFISALFDGLNTCQPADKPKDAQFSPENRSDCEILIANGKGEKASLYYILEMNMLIYPDRTNSKDGQTLLYRYYTASDMLTGILRDQQQNARLTQEDSIKPWRNPAELKSSIDPAELAEVGTDIDFEFVTESLPDNTGTACRIYTNAESSAVPQDSYLVIAYGKSQSGEQEKLSIQGMEANANYTKVIVALPDAALDSLDTGKAMPDSYAAIVKKVSVDPEKWIVFVDGDDNIIDVILPEDISSASTTAG